ncbi:MAG: division/cell wall cluster transcriptional repressor MraZ [Chloroflexi bacterium HGW-Chloroflexi-8]|nr:MAG: division/cell wall cluster transcriptional repressor MraZ [Chloroflexi bacterium HGW-Chloroflexi-8]
MFLGTYEHTIDDKGRMTIPVRFRELINEGAYITLGFDHNLMVLTNQVFSNLSTRVNEMSITNPVARDLRRLMFSNAIQVEVDKAGRILIPSFLRNMIQLDGQAIVIGAGGYFEIWSPEIWSPRSENILNSETNEQRYATLDLSLQL